jgi:hypothetical protein
MGLQKSTARNKVLSGAFLCKNLDFRVKEIIFAEIKNAP